MARELGSYPDAGADGRSNLTLSGEYLDELERRYAPPDACRVCGHAMIMGEVLHDHAVLWMCGSPQANPRTTPLVPAALSRYMQSRAIREPADEDMLALIREVRRLREASSQKVPAQEATAPVTGGLTAGQIALLLEEVSPGDPVRICIWTGEDWMTEMIDTALPAVGGLRLYMNSRGKRSYLPVSLRQEKDS